MERHSVERRVVKVVAKKNFLPVFVKKTEIFEFFETYITFPNAHSYLEDPFAQCLAGLTTLFLTGAEIFGGREIPAGEFHVKKIENADFFRGQVRLFHNTPS